MDLTLPASARVLLQQAQRACRGQAGYVPVTVLLLLDQGHAAATVAQALAVDVSSVYWYAQTDQLQGLMGYLRAEQPGYWGLLTSAQLAGLCRELDHQLYTDCRPIANWLAATYRVRYSVSGLTDLLGYSYKLTTALPCQAAAVAQTAFLTDTLAPLLVQAAAGDAVVYFADAARNAHCPTQAPPRQDRLRQRPKHPTPLRKTARRPPARPNTRHLRQRPPRPKKTFNAWLADKRLVQVFLPPYSPNLNRMERLWKFLRQKISNTAFCRTKGPFKTAVLDFFDRLPEFGSEPASRMRLKFHVLDSQTTS